MFNEYVKKEGNGQNVTMFLLYNIHNMIYCVQYVYHHLSVHPIVEQTQEERQNFDV